MWCLEKIKYLCVIKVIISIKLQCLQKRVEEENHLIVLILNAHLNFSWCSTGVCLVLTLSYIV